MAFTEEDGTGVSGANAYISVAFADTYHDDRGHTAWVNDGTTNITDEQKQEAIIRATDHIDRVFGNFFRGYKETDAQGLQWPRVEAFDPNDFVLSGVPDQLQRATAEYALRALLYGVLTPDPPPKGPRQTLTSGASLAIYGEGEGEIVTTREKVGPIETETRYNPATSGSLARHPAADMILRPLLRSRTNTIVRG